jgi:hypothetical protein
MWDLRIYKLKKLSCAKVKTHGKDTSLSCVFQRRTTKGTKKIVFLLGANGGNGRWKIFLPCAIEKTHGKLKGLPCVSKKTHGKLFFTVRFLFAVRPI